MFKPGDKIRRKVDLQNGPWLAATERKNLPADTIVTVEKVYYEKVILREDIGIRLVGWNTDYFEKIPNAKPLENYL